MTRKNGDGPKLRLFSALSDTFREGYSFSNFQSDILAGIIVAIVAIPLGMALAIASGVAPQYGLYTVIVGGFLIALFGGSRCQVSGPTAAFVVILAPIAQTYGYSGLLIAGMMAGVILLVMGLSRLGKYIQFIPYPVTTGFTAGIAVVIAVIQLKDFFGLRVEHMPENFLGRAVALANSAGSFSPHEFFVGAVTLMILILWPRFSKKMPAPIVALTFASLMVIAMKHWIPNVEIATIGSRFSYELNGVLHQGIPQTLPRLGLPWASAEGPSVLSFQTIKALVPSAFAIAILGAIESLLSAVVADGMAHTKHDPDGELTALGIGNIVCPFFGGIAATGAIARTATNIRSGAKSPVSAMTHALFTLLVILIFAPYVSYLPMASMAALLLLVAYNMSEVKQFLYILRVAPKSDVGVLLICFGLTVFFDMVTGVTVGIVLAAFLFMKRMSTLTSGELNREVQHVLIREALPKEIVVYEIAGPLFFGAADRAMRALEAAGDDIRAVIFVMDQVPTMDMTGLVALERSIKSLTHHRRLAFLAGVKPYPHRLIERSGLLNLDGVRLCGSLDEAIELAVEKI